MSTYSLSAAKNNTWSDGGNDGISNDYGSYGKQLAYSSYNFIIIQLICTLDLLLIYQIPMQIIIQPQYN